MHHCAVPGGMRVPCTVQHYTGCEFYVHSILMHSCEGVSDPWRSHLPRGTLRSAASRDIWGTCEPARAVVLRVPRCISSHLSASLGSPHSVRVSQVSVHRGRECYLSLFAPIVSRSILPYLLSSRSACSAISASTPLSAISIISASISISSCTFSACIVPASALAVKPASSAGCIS